MKFIKQFSILCRFQVNERPSSIHCGRTIAIKYSRMALCCHGTTRLAIYRRILPWKGKLESIKNYFFIHISIQQIFPSIFSKCKYKMELLLNSKNKAYQQMILSRQFLLYRAIGKLKRYILSWFCRTSITTWTRRGEQVVSRGISIQLRRRSAP